MNELIANVILGKLTGIEWLDRTAGVVRVAEAKIKGSDGSAKTQRFPVSVDVLPSDCEVEGPYLDLVPNDQFYSVLYFEDGGWIQQNSRGQLMQVQSTLKMVGWLNGDKIGGSGADLGARAVQDVIKKLQELPRVFSEGDLTRIQIRIVGEEKRNNRIFSEYTYDETVTQHLMYPHDYFALNLNISFWIPSSCLTSLSPADPVDYCEHFVDHLNATQRACLEITSIYGGDPDQEFEPEYGIIGIGP